MKRRSVTFTDNPPEIIDNDNDRNNMCTPLPTANIFLWLQLARIERRQRKYASETQRKWQEHRYSRSIPDLSKQEHYLSVESKSAEFDFNSNMGRNIFQQRQLMDPINLSVSDFDMTLQSRPQLRSTIESVRNVAKIDIPWDLHNLCKKERKEKLLQHHGYESVSDYFLTKHRNVVVAADATTESTVKNSADMATKSFVKNSIDYELRTQHKNSANDDSNRNKNDVACTDASDSIIYRSYINDNRNDSENHVGNVDNNVVNIIKNSDRSNESNSNCGKFIEQSLQRYHYHYLSDYKKTDSILKTAKNWSWKNIVNNGSTSRRCYSLLNEPLQQKNYHRRHHSSDTRNTSFFFASTTNNNSSTKNITTKHQWYYSSMIYSKMQQQLVDEMAKHIAECLEQFNTGLDKVLQARQLVKTSQELPADDRETMLRLLNQAMRISLKRMECNDDRYDPDGRHSESPNSLSGQRAPGQQLCGTSDGNANFHNVTSSVDPTEFFQQHGQQLLALLQQNMAKQN
uniref:Uncharacterized protein n=1 Tax=Onchocerca volvulus TaxID=6282 RepID=A0A8R1Y601_ONCVO